MPPSRKIHRVFARTDTRAIISIASVLLVGLCIQGFLLYAYVAMESLEEADRWLEHSIDSVAPSIDRGDRADAVMQRLLVASRVELANAIRVIDRNGRLIDTWGSWPPDDRIVPEDTRDLGSWRLLRPGNFLVGSARLAGDNIVEISLPLDHFAEEAAELRRGIILVALGSALLALLIAAFATIRAFAPLRRATSLLRDVDAHQLGRRLPNRHTRDPVDVHAETLNQVLARIDDAFDRLKSFSSDAAHELRTPLNRMANVSEVALLGGKDDEIRAALESLKATTHHLSTTVGSLLLLAELDDERFDPSRERISTPDLVGDAVAATRANLGGTTSLVIADTEAAEVEGEERLLARALGNLIENAARHGSRVELRAERADSRVRILVDDDGPGVPAGSRSRIFERFARLEGSAGGSGIGLALARAIARAHGGDVTVEDSPLLEGARFVLDLPAAVGPLPRVSPTARGGRRSTPSRRRGTGRGGNRPGEGTRLARTLERGDHPFPRSPDARPRS